MRVARRIGVVRKDVSINVAIKLAVVFLRSYKTKTLLWKHWSLFSEKAPSLVAYFYYNLQDMDVATMSEILAVNKHSIRWELPHIELLIALDWNAFGWSENNIMMIQSTLMKILRKIIHVEEQLGCRTQKLCQEIKKSRFSIEMTFMFCRVLCYTESVVHQPAVFPYIWV